MTRQRMTKCDSCGIERLCEPARAGRGRLWICGDCLSRVIEESELRKAAQMVVAHADAAGLANHNLSSMEYAIEDLRAALSPDRDG